MASSKSGKGSASRQRGTISASPAVSQEVSPRPTVKVRYRKPPIAEAIVEFLFDEIAPDPAVGGRFYEAAKTQCVQRDQFQTQQVVFQFGQGVGTLPPAPPLPSERLWLSKKPGLAMQVGAGLLSIHFVRNPPLVAANQGSSYPGFEWFVPHIKDGVARYQGLVKPRGIRQVSMRYINRIEVPLMANGISENWLETGVALPGAFGNSIRQFSLDLGIDIEKIDSDLRYILRAGPVSATSLPIWLDLRVTSKSRRAPSFDALSGWLQQAHQEGIIRYFEQSITDLARKHFGVIHATA